MKKIIQLLLITVLISSCVSIPKETVQLSKALGSDLKVLQTSHRNVVSIYYEKIKDNIDIFIKDVYAPFVINYVLKKELTSYKGGQESIFKSLNAAAQKSNAATTEKATKDMQDFLSAANRQIEKKKAELLNPIETQETELLLKIDQSYQNAMYANSTITAYLSSVSKLKETQQEALAMIGLKGIDSLVTKRLLQLSENVKEAIQKGKEIDTKSDDAVHKIKEITDKIKALTQKNN
jgi:vacuolar-type H+-ATPase subunit H